jgi:hypothetical protein
MQSAARVVVGSAKRPFHQSFQRGIFSMINKIKQKMDRLATQIRDLLNTTDTENRVWTSEEREKYNRMEE